MIGGDTCPVALIVSGVAQASSLRPGGQAGSLPYTEVIALGLVPIVLLVFVAVAEMPLVNDLATDRPLIAALEKQHVPGNDIALYFCPRLWAHDMPRDLEQVHYGPPQGTPTLIATARARGSDIAPQLAGYHVVDSVKMIGKWFDVYRR